MTRPIKFRAWDNVNKKWVTDEGISRDGYLYHLNGITLEGIPFERECGDGGLYLTELEDIELTQFTGMLDKNQKEIWEGDICKFIFDDIGTIEFSNGCFKWSWLLPSFQDLEVIGNRFEHPHLLEGE